MPRKVFYSWQNSLDTKRHHYFIREALVKALDRLGDDPEIEERPELDSDTSGIPGSPYIVSAILEKIDACDVFVPDLTIVHRGHDWRGKDVWFPNSNVLFETGYAVKSRGYERIICVMNKAEGTPENLPFDLRAHRLATYDLPPDGDKRVASKQLASLFEEALRLVLKLPGANARATDPFVPLPESDEFKAARAAVEGRLVSYQFTVVPATAAVELSLGTVLEALKLASTGNLATDGSMFDQFLRGPDAPRGGAPRPYLSAASKTANGGGIVFWRLPYRGQFGAGEEHFFLEQSGRLGYQRASAADELDLGDMVRDAAIFLRLAGHTFFNVQHGRANHRPELLLSLAVAIEPGKSQKKLVARVFDDRGLVTIVPPTPRWGATTTADDNELFVDRGRLAKAIQRLLRKALNGVPTEGRPGPHGVPFLDVGDDDVLAAVERATKGSEPRGLGYEEATCCMQVA